MNIFSEIYGTYFRIAAKLLANEETDEKTVRETVQRYGFRDSGLFLPKKLIPGDKDWGLFFRTNDGKLGRITQKAPVKVLTRMQKMWLKSKLLDPRIRLFMDDETLSKLDKRFEKISPLYREEHFCFIDRFSNSDNYLSEDYIRIFRSALEAVKLSKIVRIDYTSRYGKPRSGEYVLLKMEYSPKNDKFRAYYYLLLNDKVANSGIINIGRITKIVDTGRTFKTPISIDDYFSCRKCSSPAVIRVTTERNGVERFMLEFAPYEKHTVRDLETGEYTVKLWYDKQDETELLIRLLSFGPVIEILGPKKLREEATQRIKIQLELLNENCNYVNDK